MNNKKHFIRKATILRILEHFIPFVKDKEKKIRIVELFAHYYSTQISGIYADEYLEKILCNIGKSIKLDMHQQTEDGTVLHVMTVAYCTGGHTRVVDNWIKFDSERQHSVIFTDNVEARKKLPDFLLNTVKKSGGKILFLKGTSYIEKAKKLFQIASKYEKIVLHVHMYDPIPVLAFSNKAWTKTIYYFNHANYRFWLGASIADVCLEISENDRRISRNLRGIRTCRRLDIPIDDMGFYNDDLKILRKEDVLEDIFEEEQIITTMGAQYKYNTSIQYNFYEFAEQLLSSNDKIILVVIGPNKNEKNWKALVNKFKRRIRVMGVLDKDSVSKIMSVTDLYINSFPLGSYTSCLDATIRGIKVVGLDIEGQMLDSCRMNAKRTSTELIQYINDLLKGNVEYKQNKLEGHFKSGWNKEIQKIYTLTPEHKLHKFTSKVRYGTYEEIVQRTYKDNEIDENLYFGIWYYIFKLIQLL